MCPLPSVLNGAAQCTKLCKRTGIRCKNPCAFGSQVACKTHGSHRSKNVRRGKDHPKYKKGHRTKEFEKQHRQTAINLLLLRDIGGAFGILPKNHPPGRKPEGYKRYNCIIPAELYEALALTMTPSEREIFVAMYQSEPVPNE